MKQRHHVISFSLSAVFSVFQDNKLWKYDLRLRRKNIPICDLNRR